MLYIPKPKRRQKWCHRFLSFMARRPFFEEGWTSGLRRFRSSQSQQEKAQAQWHSCDKTDALKATVRNYLSWYDNLESLDSAARFSSGQQKATGLAAMWLVTFSAPSSCHLNPFKTSVRQNSGRLKISKMNNIEQPVRTSSNMFTLDSLLRIQ